MDGTPAPAARRWLERWGRPLLAGAALALIAGLWAARAAQVRHGLRGYREAHSEEFRSREFPGLSERDLVLLSTAHSTDQRPAGSYTLVPERKPPGTVRIGVFGCSFVHGAEVAPGADFPSRLGARLAAAGRADVEVINFGVGGYGMHQSALLWQLAGRRWDLDYVLFNLYPFHEQRDASFVHGALDFAPIHSRFVLRGGEAVRIDPLGATRLEAAESYSRFATPWRYARYDARGPAFLRALLPRGRELARNPFYYFPGGVAAEARQLYPALFARVAAEGGHGLIVVCNGAASRRHAAALRERGVEVIAARASDLARQRPSLYLAPLGHLGALGNELVAAELAAALTGAGRPRLPLLEIEPLDAYPAAAGSPRRLRPGHRPALWIGPHRVATLHGGMPGGSRRTPFRPLGTAALLDVSTGQELVFLPLAEPLAGGEPIELAFRLDGRPVRAAVGAVEATAPVLGRPRWTGGIAGDGWSLPDGGLDLAGAIALRSDRRLSDLEILVAGRPALHGEPRPADPGERRFRLRPAVPLVHARAEAGGPVAAGDLPARGTLDLVLAFHDPRRNRPLPRIPVAAYRRRTVVLSAPEPPLPPPAAPAGFGRLPG